MTIRTDEEFAIARRVLDALIVYLYKQSHRIVGGQTAVAMVKQWKDATYPQEKAE